MTEYEGGEEGAFYCFSLLGSFVKHDVFDGGYPILKPDAFAIEYFLYVGGDSLFAVDSYYSYVPTCFDWF